MRIKRRLVQFAIVSDRQSRVGRILEMRVNAMRSALVGAIIGGSVTVATCFVGGPRFALTQWRAGSVGPRQMRLFVASASTSTSGKVIEPNSNVRTAADEGVKPGTAEMGVPWEELGFEFRSTKSHVRVTYKDGAWGPVELEQDPFIKVHMGATALHYGQACFEGLKAFCHEDGSVHVFRPDENAKRMEASCTRVMMPPMPEDLFLDAVSIAVRDNIAYVPPYGSNGALYLRPLLFGSGPRIGLQPADEYTFLLMVIPVGDYYKGGLSSKVKCFVSEDYDRAAPRGVGAAKVAGNYAADLLPNFEHKEKGFPITLYSDAKTNTLVEEFSTSNFIGFQAKDKKYVTPRSSSVLPSITNLSLMTMAEDMGWTVERRDIPLDELSSFDEVVACGTAVVVTPIGSIKHGEKDHVFGSSDDVGEVTLSFYRNVRGIQNGEMEDKFGWNYKVY